MLKPRVGDLVRLKPVEVYQVDKKTGQFCTTHFLHGSAWYRPEDVEEVIPIPLAVGERVRFIDEIDCGNVLTILAIDGEEAWIKWPNGCRDGQLLSVLRRLDPS